MFFIVCVLPLSPSGGLSGVSGIWISNWIVWIRNLVCSPIPARTYGLHKFLTRPHKLLLKQEDFMQKQVHESCTLMKLPSQPQLSLQFLFRGCEKMQNVSYAVTQATLSKASKPSAARNSWVNSDLRYNADEPAIYSVFGERSNKHLDRQHTFLRK